MLTGQRFALRGDIEAGQLVRDEVRKVAGWG